MKEKLIRALSIALGIATGITLITLKNGEPFSLLKTALYAIVAFIVDCIFTFLFDKKDPK